MIKYHPGLDIFESGATALVNPVNCQGVMGRGLALEFRKRFTRNYQAYVEACRTRELVPGKLHATLEGDQWIVNLPTKDHWREPSTLGLVSRSIAVLARWIDQHDIESIAIPRLGCGLGGLRWQEQVLPLIRLRLGQPLFHPLPGVEYHRNVKIMVLGNGPKPEPTPLPF